MRTVHTFKSDGSIDSNPAVAAPLDEIEADLAQDINPDAYHLAAIKYTAQELLNRIRADDFIITDAGLRIIHELEDYIRAAEIMNENKNRAAL